MSSPQSLGTVLDRVREFIGTLAWAPDEMLDVMTLVLALTHVKDAFTSVPYVLITSTKPKVGKTTMSTDIPMLLASGPWEVNTLTTEPAIRAKFMDREPPDTLCAPDIGKLFGESGLNGRTSKQYQLLVAGYRRTGKIEVSVNRVATQVPAYFVAFLDGLNNAVPHDLATRSIRFTLEPKPAHVRMRDALSAPVQGEAEPLKKALHRQATSRRREMALFMRSGVLRVHPLLTDRVMQLWGPLFAVAHAAGGDWPARCMSAFLEYALDESDKPVLLRDEEALLDAAKIALRTGARVLFAADLVQELRELPNPFYGDVDDQYLVTDLLPRALGPSSQLRGPSLDGRTVTGQGWRSAAVLDAAAALEDQLHPQPGESGPDAVQRALTLTEVG